MYSFTPISVVKLHFPQNLIMTVLTKCMSKYLGELANEAGNLDPFSVPPFYIHLAGLIRARPIFLG